MQSVLVQSSYNLLGIGWLESDQLILRLTCSQRKEAKKKISDISVNTELILDYQLMHFNKLL